MDSIAAFVGVIVAVSIGVERVVELIKGIVPLLSSTWKRHDGYRIVLVQLLSVVLGAIIAWQMRGQIANTLPRGLKAEPGMPLYLLVGLLAGGGSGLWNHVLDIVRATKLQSESKVGAAMKAAPAAGTGKGGGS